MFDEDYEAAGVRYADLVYGTDRVREFLRRNDYAEDILEDEEESERGLDYDD